MLKKVKTLIFTLSASIMLLVPAVAMPVMVHAAAAAAPTADINNSLCGGSNLEFSDTANANACNTLTNNSVSSINKIVALVINIFSVIVGIVAVIMIIVGGIRYVTSGGNDQSVASAKNTILYAIIGLVVVGLAQIIVKFVLNRVTL